MSRREWNLAIKTMVCGPPTQQPVTVLRYKVLNIFPFLRLALQALVLSYLNSLQAFSFFVYVLLTVHLSIILATNQLNAQNLLL